MNLMERLRAYGADIDGAMERFLDDAELYEECLQMFLHDVNFAKLRDSLAAKEYRSAFEAAHTLKGVSGNLGLTPAYRAICVLVESLRGQHYENLAAEYGEVCVQMEALNALQ